jgi:LacI family transcriptional regulator
MRPIVTQVELAKRLGVTQMTVSRALNGTGNLSQATRDKVQALALKLGYRANGMARRVHEGRYRGMALLGSSTRLGYNIADQEFHFSVGSTLAQRSWHLTEGWLPGESLADPVEVSGLLDRLLADAVLVHDVGTHPPLVEKMLSTHRVPAVWVNGGKSADAVDFADAAAAAAAVELLLAQGYRRPALVLYGVPNTPDTHCSVHERMRGYAEGCAKAGIPARIVHEDAPRSTREGSVALIRALLEGSDRPDAIVAYAWGVAMTTRVLAGDRGLRIGRDLGLVCFARETDANLDIPYTVCALDYPALGRESVAMAWRRLETGRSQKQVLIPIPIVRPGASTTRTA